MFDSLVNKFKNSKLKIKEGKFGEVMNITLKNNGPMTIFLDTKS
jgi:D-Tyr-tRNAtyr deacylase